MQLNIPKQNQELVSEAISVEEMGGRRAVRYKGQSSQAERPLKHFCKSISSDDLEDKKMKLPNAFVNEFGDELSDVVEVIDPKGHKWEIGLTKSEKHIWFDIGWHDFVQHYSIYSGFLLFFGYRGLSNFSVRICDMTDYEISYPYNGPERKDKGPTNGEQCSSDIGHGVVNKDFVENTGNVESSKRAEEQNEEINEQDQPTVASSKNRKSNRLHMERSKKRMMEEQVEAGTDDSSKSKRWKFDEQGMSWTWMPFVNGRKDGEEKLPRKRKRDAEGINTGMFTSGFELASEKSEKAIDNASKLKTKYPSLMVVLRPYHLYNAHMYLPGEFTRKHMSNVPEYINLRVSDGREWVARLLRARQSLTIGSGCRFFIKENNLEEGDVLVLEWIKKDNTMEVSIFRADEKQCDG